MGSLSKASRLASATASAVGSQARREASHRRASRANAVVSVRARVRSHISGSAWDEDEKPVPMSVSLVSTSSGGTASRPSMLNPWQWLSMTSAAASSIGMGRLLGEVVGQPAFSANARPLA